ncbi:MAG TPA: type VI secretion system baseplate subunit TssG [Chloroflexia bacterium]|nr:type VI secretion system baseplate subunit TssG [Chloroflexia bacterium]
MGSDGRRPAGSVEQALYSEGRSFDFYQAVKLLELLDPGASPVGEGTLPNREAVRFQSTAGYAVAGSDIAGVKGAEESGPATMWVNFMGLAGPQGPLPVPFTRMLLDRLQEGDTSMRDFLDIFNHRLVSLMYRVRKAHRIGFAPGAPSQDRFAAYMYALIGLGTEGLRDRLAVPDAVLLRYTGLLVQHPRSAAGLERVLADYFQVETRVRQFRGEWVRLEPDQWTAIGATGRNQALGRGFLLGRSIYDVQGKLEVCLGPLDLRPFLDLLPVGQAFRALRALAGFYLQDALHFDLRLRLKAAQVPAFRLGGNRGSRLGWTTWLKTRPFCDDAEVALRLASSFAKSGG